MKVKIKLKESTIERILHKIEIMLLNNKLSLTDISRCQRINNKSFYIMALRAARVKHNSDNYIKCLKILKNDIIVCNDDKLKKQLIELLNDYITFAPYNGDEKFECFKKQMSVQEIFEHHRKCGITLTCINQNIHRMGRKEIK